jgi:hypothetical protein
MKLSSRALVELAQGPGFNPQRAPKKDILHDIIPKNYIVYSKHIQT